MKSGKLIAALIGSWFVYIGLDGAYGKIGKRGSLLLSRPMQMMFNTTRTIRLLVLFELAIITFLLVAKQLVESKKTCKDNED